MGNIENQPQAEKARTLLAQLEYISQVLPLMKDALCLKDEDLGVCAVIRFHLNAALDSDNQETRCKAALQRSRVLLAESLFRQGCDCGHEAQRRSMAELVLPCESDDPARELEVPRLPTPSLSGRFWRHFFSLVPSDSGDGRQVYFARNAE